MAMMLTEKIADKDPSPHIVFCAGAVDGSNRRCALRARQAQDGALGSLHSLSRRRRLPVVSTGWVLAVGGMRVMVPPDVQVNFDLLPQLLQRGALRADAVWHWLCCDDVLHAGTRPAVLHFQHFSSVEFSLTHVIIAIDPDLSIAKAQESGWLLRVSDNLNGSMPFIPFATGAMEWPAVRNSLSSRSLRSFSSPRLRCS